MTIDAIRTSPSDDALYDLLAHELASRLPNPRRPTDAFVRELQMLPRGLRAMAATYELDVSLLSDDLGWHFGNWHHVGLAQETLEGLRELGAHRMAELFNSAFHLARGYWDELGSENWFNWYHGSALEKAVEPLNHEAYEIRGSQPRGLFSYWLSYARQHPQRLV
jgi:hypothetical protein